MAWGPFPFPGPEHQTALREALAVILDGASREEYAVCKAMLITGATQELAASRSSGDRPGCGAGPSSSPRPVSS